MSSRTSDARTYKIEIGKAKLTIIDTPGFGDTRGLGQDQLHYNRIKEAVMEEGGINCVCIVQNSTENRMNAHISYSYSSLLSILPKTIANQIIIVYTM